MSNIMSPLRHMLAAITGNESHGEERGSNMQLASAAVEAAVLRALCEPVSPTSPCGESLEYDTEYAVLQSRLSPKADVQYGNFSSKPEAPDWLEVERDAKRLLLKSKDISILVWFCRARARMAGASGLLEGLATLRALLLAYPVDIHPQVFIEGQSDPAVRANALAALCDPEGLLGDLREIVVIANTAFRLTVRDAERAFAVPRSPYAADPENIKRQLADLHNRRDENLMALLACERCVHDIAVCAAQQLQDDAPDLGALVKLLAPLASFDAPATMAPKVPAQAIDRQAMDRQAMEHPISQHSLVALAGAALPMHGGNVAEQREQVRQMLQQVRQWIDQNEPSSPVSVMLKQADRMWGKRFSEVATMIPPDLLQAWDRED